MPYGRQEYDHTLYRLTDAPRMYLFVNALNAPLKCRYDAACSTLSYVPTRSTVSCEPSLPFQSCDEANVSSSSVLRRIVGSTVTGKTRFGSRNHVPSTSTCSTHAPGPPDSAY